MKTKITSIVLLIFTFLILNNNVFATDQIIITGTVPAQASDYQQTLESLTPGTIFAQETTIDYKITYSSTHTAPTIPLIIKVQWTQGTIQGESTPTIDVLEYVVGSASQAYGSTPPVIDTINRTITWTIPNFQANTTNQTVTWQLKTTNSYTFAPKVNFTISSNLITPTFTTASQSLDQSYLNNNPTTPTPTPNPTTTPTPAPTSSSNQTPTPTPTETPKTIIHTINSISISTISTNFTDIILKTNFTPKSTTVFYGTDINNLNQTISDQDPSSIQKITLQNLSPKTDYYFKIIVKDYQDKSITSDIFTFTTASISPIATTDSQSIVFISKGLIIYNTAKDSLPPTNQPTLFTNTPFEINFDLQAANTLKQAILIIRPKQILGSNSEGLKPYYFETKLLPNPKGNITAKLKSPSQSGIYEIILKISDTNGNLYNQKISDLKIFSPLIVLDKKTGLPIERALVKISLFNQTTKIFQSLSATSLIATNPQLTDNDGVIKFTPLLGTFRFEISALNYQKETIELTITDETPPEIDPILLKQANINIIDLLVFYKETGFDLYQNITSLLTKIISSRRYLSFSNLTIITFFTILTLISFKSKTHLKLRQLPHYLIFHLKAFLNKSKQVSFITATLKDSQTKKPVSLAQVFIINKKTNKTIYTTHTNRLGHFHFSISKNTSFKLKIYKQNYQELSLSNLQDQDKDSNNFTLEISPTENKYPSSLKSFTQIITEIFASLFETLLLTSFILEFIFLLNHNIITTLPFVIISFLNFIVWTIYLHQKSLSQH